MKGMLMVIALVALAACAEGIEGEIGFAGKFSGEKPVERATVDIPWKVDLRKSRGIVFEIKCDRIRECSHFSCYFHKGFTVFNFDVNALPVLDALSTGRLLRDPKPSLGF